VCPFEIGDADLDQIAEVGSFAELTQRNDERSRDIIGAVPVLDPRLRTEGMLKDAIRVGEGEDVIERWL
jgi:hypothetical protein